MSDWGSPEEANHPASEFTSIFQRAREAGLRALPHGGEGAGPDSVRACVEQLGASRVCHGVRSVEDPAVVALLLERRVCLDVCPSSNVSLQVSPSLGQHQLRALLDSGVAVSLNSDGPLFSGATVNDEYRLAHERMGVSAVARADIANTSIQASSCPPLIRDTAIAGIRDWASKHGEKGDQMP